MLRQANPQSARYTRAGDSQRTGGLGLYEDALPGVHLEIETYYSRSNDSTSPLLSTRVRVSQEQMEKGDSEWYG